MSGAQATPARSDTSSALVRWPESGLPEGAGWPVWAWVPTISAVPGWRDRESLLGDLAVSAENWDKVDVSTS